MAALILASHCHPDSFIINMSNASQWQAGLSSCFLGLGLFDFHLSHSCKARCIDNARQGRDFKGNSSLRWSMGFPQKRAVPLVRPISSSSAASVGVIGKWVQWGEEWNPCMIHWITPEISQENLHAKTSPISFRHSQPEIKEKGKGLQLHFPDPQAFGSPPHNKQWTSDSGGAKN